MSLVDVGWHTPAGVPGVPALRDLVNEFADCHGESQALVNASMEITLGWYASGGSNRGGVRTRHLVEDPLGVILTELGQFVAAVRAFLLARHVHRVVLVGPARTPWLHWTAAVAGSLGIAVHWRPRLSARACLRWLAESAWPLLSPLANAGRSAARRGFRAGGHDHAKGRVRFLFVAEFPRADHLESFERVARELGGEIDWLLPWNPEPAVLVERWLAERGRTGIHLRDYYSLKSAARELVFRQRLQREARAEIQRLVETHLPGREYAWPAYQSAMAKSAWHLTPRAEGIRAAAESLLQRRRPAAVLLASDYNFTSRIVTAAARFLAIPTVQMQHGAAFSGAFWGLPVFSTRLATWSQDGTDWYASHGVPPEVLCQTGAPRYDCLGEPIPQEQRLPASDKPLVLIITSRMPPAQTSAVLAAARDAIRGANRPVRVLVKTHPTEPPEIVAPLLGDWGPIPVTVQCEGDSLALVRQASFVISARSTVMFEAILAGCPVVHACLPELDGFDHDPEAPFLTAQDRPQFAEFVQRLLTDPGFLESCRRRCREYTARVWPLCGAGAARRVAELLRQEAGLMRDEQTPMRAPGPRRSTCHP